MTVDSARRSSRSRGVRPTSRATALEELCGSMATAWLLTSARAGSRLPRPRGGPAACGSARRRREMLLRLHASTRSSSSSATCGLTLAASGGRRGHAARVLARRPRRWRESFHARPCDFEREAASRRSARRTRARPASSGSPRSRRPLAVSRPSAAREPCPRRRRSRDQELEGRPGAAPGVEHAVDLPLGQHADRLDLRASRPVGELRQAPELTAPARTPCSTRALEPLLPTGTSKPASRSAVVSEPKVCQ